jgi:hypothetical protein
VLKSNNINIKFSQILFLIRYAQQFNRFHYDYNPRVAPECEEKSTKRCVDNKMCKKCMEKANHFLREQVLGDWCVWQRKKEKKNAARCR